MLGIRRKKKEMHALENCTVSNWSLSTASRDRGEWWWEVGACYIYECLKLQSSLVFSTFHSISCVGPATIKGLRALPFLASKRAKNGI